MEIEKRNELVEFLMELRDDENELKSKLKALREEIESLESELIQNMIETNNPSFKHRDATITVAITERVSPEPERKGDLWTAMKENGFEDLFTINAQTLQGTVKDIKSNNDDQLPQWLDGLVKIFEQPSLRITKNKKY